MTGVQRPRVWSVPPAASSAGQDAAELAASVGLVLDEWQRFVLDGALGERADGTWAAFLVYLEVCRQNGKGAVLEAFELASLFLFGARLVTHTAHQVKTHKEHFRRVVDRIDADDSLSRRVLRVVRVNGEEAIELKSRQRLRFMARSTGSGRGLSGDVVVLDEVMFATDEMLGALIPTMAAIPNGQVWAVGSAPLAASPVQRRIRERHRAGGDPRMASFEWSVAEPDRGEGEETDLDDRRLWAAANPALGIRLTEEFTEDERGLLSDEEFARERLGLADAPGGNAVIADRLWASLGDPGSQHAGRVALALATTPDHVSSSIGVAGRRSDGRWHVEVVDSEEGVGWAVPRLAELAKRWKPVAVAVDPSGPAAAKIPALQKAGVKVAPVAGREHGQACGLLYEAAAAGQLRHIGQAPLTVAVAAGRKRKTGDGVWVWSRKDDTDISPLEAVTLALFAHARWEAEQPRGPKAPPLDPDAHVDDDALSAPAGMRW